MGKTGIAVLNAAVGWSLPWSGKLRMSNLVGPSAMSLWNMSWREKSCRRGRRPSCLIAQNHLIERAAALLKAANVSQGLPPRADELGGNEIPAPPHREAAAGARPPGRKQVSLAAPPSFIPTAEGLKAPTKLGRTVSELRRESKQPALSIAALERAGLMVARMNRTRTTEEYRIVIGRVLRALHDGQEAEVSLGSTAPSNVVMVTSARPGEGKSFTSLNLGGSIAQNAGESVLIVDVDAKNNSMTDMLGLSDRKGFLDLVADPDLSPDDLIIPSDIANLSFLALGSRSAVRESAEGGGIEERRLTTPYPKACEALSSVADTPRCTALSLYERPTYSVSGGRAGCRGGRSGTNAAE